MVVLILLLVVVLVLVYLFFVPFYIDIDSKKGLFRIRFGKLASANLDLTVNSIILVIKVLGFEKRIDLLERKKIIEKKREVKSLNLKREEKGVSWKKVKGVLTSFKVNKFDISIDTGDMQLNGILYPVCGLLSFLSKKNIRINFIEENEIVVEIENNLARMSWAFISS